MNVEVKHNNDTGEFVVQKLFADRDIPENTDSPSPKVIWISSSSGVVLILLLVLICLCRRRRRKRGRLGNGGRVVSASTTTTLCPSVYVVPSKVELRTTEDVTRRYQRSVSNLSAKSQIYLVPFDVLPHDFDFASREVEVKADYVILKDLTLLERYPSNGIINKAYETQEPYNPYIDNGSIPLGLAGERHQKQLPYNPTFY